MIEAVSADPEEIQVVRQTAGEVVPERTRRDFDEWHIRTLERGAEVFHSLAAGSVVEEALAGKGSGAPLPAVLRVEMEARLRTGFGAVRVHDDAGSHAAARAIGARAFTDATRVNAR